MDGICVGMVLFNPDIELLKNNIDSLYQQIDKLYFFDNASTNHEKIEKLLIKYDNRRIVYFHSDENLGIGAGFNSIFKWAFLSGHEWVLTMDQDSLCDRNMIATYKKYLEEKDVAVICPFVLNNGKITLEEYQKMPLDDFDYMKKSIQCITSGSLINIAIAGKIGLFNESLFVDCVDNEFYIRVLYSGYHILRANRTYLIQKMGDAKEIGLIKKLRWFIPDKVFRKLSIVTVCTDYRLYLGNRNAKYIRKKYKNVDINYSFLYLFLLNIYFTLTFPMNRNRIRMWKNILKGNRDWKKIADIEGLDYSMFSDKNIC